jgi:hypothetical protein
MSRHSNESLYNNGSLGEAEGKQEESAGADFVFQREGGDRPRFVD